MKRDSPMEQSDLHLLQTVPAYHMQAILKTRLAAQSVAGKSLEGAPDAASEDLEDLAAFLFEPDTCREVLLGLGPAESCVLRELVSCGGGAESRGLGLYPNLPDFPFSPFPMSRPRKN